MEASKSSGCYQNDKKIVTSCINETIKNYRRYSEGPIDKLLCKIKYSKLHKKW